MIMSLRAGKYLLMNAVCAAVPMAMMAAMGCSGEPSLLATERDVGQNEDKQSEDKNGDGSQDVRPPQTGNGSHATVTAPGMKLAAYPPGPYGTKSGATIANEEFYGWRNPAAVAFDLGRAETIRLSDYYNAQAVPGQGVEYILLNVVASWCGVCRSEYTNIAADQVYAALAPRGLEIIGVLYEDNNSEPSRFVDMSNWAQAFSVSFPFTNDPGFKMGRYFDRSATPMNMLVDARTMRIVDVGTGYRPTMFEEISVLLRNRGR